MSKAGGVDSNAPPLGVCKYQVRDVAELHNQTDLNDDMLFSTIVLSKEIHNDERCIVACSFCNDRLGQQIHIFDGMNDELIKSRVLHKKESSKMITSFDVFLISCSSTGNIVIVDARTGGINKKLNFSDFEVEDICVHGNSSHSEVLQVIMTKSEDIDNKIYIMEMKTEEIATALTSIDETVHEIGEASGLAGKVERLDETVADLSVELALVSATGAIAIAVPGWEDEM